MPSKLVRQTLLTRNEPSNESCNRYRAESLERFLQLRQRCVELEQIAADLKQPGDTSSQLFEDFIPKG